MCIRDREAGTFSGETLDFDMEPLVTYFPSINETNVHLLKSLFYVFGEKALDPYRESLRKYESWVSDNMRTKRDCQSFGDHSLWLLDLYAFCGDVDSFHRFVSSFPREYFYSFAITNGFVNCLKQNHKNQVGDVLKEGGVVIS